MGTVGYLLDTHTFLWSVHEDNTKLSSSVISLFSAPDAPIYVSAASAYEVMNKYRIGKLSEFEYVAKNYLKILNNFGAKDLFVNTHHAHFAGEFDWYHRDPFDRILAAQAYIDNLVLITNDPVFKTLPWVQLLW